MLQDAMYPVWTVRNVAIFKTLERQVINQTELLWQGVDLRLADHRTACDE